MKTLVHDNFEIGYLPESYREEEINGVTYPFIDIFMYPFDKVSRNGASYRKKSGIATLNTFVGSSVLFNHHDDELIGDIAKTRPGKNQEGAEGAIGTLRLDPEEKRMIGKLKNGFLKYGSIGVIVENEEEMEDGHIECDIVEGVEYSLVTVPGFKSARIQSVRDQIIEHYHQEGVTGPLMREAEEYECECIKCGNKVKSEKHCKDIKCSKCGGDMRRVERPGPGQPSKPEGENMDDKSRSEPFADYKDFDDCVSKNQDKEDPEAYCASIKKKAEPEKPGGESMTQEQSEKLDKLEADVKGIKENLEAFGSALKEIQESLKKKPEEKYTPKTENVGGLPYGSIAPGTGEAGEISEEDKKDYTRAIFHEAWKGRR